MCTRRTFTKPLGHQFLNSDISPKTVIVMINYMLVQNLFKFKCYDKIAAPNKDNENTHLQ